MLMPSPADKSQAQGEETHVWQRGCAELQQVANIPSTVARTRASTTPPGSVGFPLWRDTWGYCAPKLVGDSKVPFPLRSLLQAGLVNRVGVLGCVCTMGEVPPLHRYRLP